MPMGYPGGSGDPGAGAGGGGAGDPGERASTPEDYKRTCIDFIEDISNDYKAWVDYYSLPEEEDRRRRAGIDATVARTNEWIAKVATSIKSIDVVMNDGIQKMAESTAGRPFQIGVFVNGMSSYAFAKPGVIGVNVKAAGRGGRKTRLGFHFKDDRFRVESTCGAFLDEASLPGGEFDMMDVNLALHAEGAAQRDVISFTVTVVEMEGGAEHDKRGVSTIVHVM